jgi:hypothetical protein
VVRSFYFSFGVLERALEAADFKVGESVISDQAPFAYLI